MPDTKTDSRGGTAAATSTGAVQLFSEPTGRGRTKAQTFISRDTVVIVIRDSLTRGERNLVAAGEVDTVLKSRRRFQETMREQLVALVETNLQRKVTAFLSDDHLDPEIAVEYFALEPVEAS